MKKTTIYLSDDQYKLLNQLKKKRGGQKISEMIRAAIDNFIQTGNNNE